MTNAWEIICNNDTFEVMRLLGFEKKFTDGSASDFECFREWCAALPLVSGHACESVTLEAIEKITGKKMSVADVTKTDAATLWRECNIALEYYNDTTISCDEKNNTKNAYNAKFACDEKINNIQDFIHLNGALRKTKTSLDDLTKNIVNSGNTNILVTFYSDEFCRPDRYHAENEYIKYIRDEKSNIDIVTSQILCELIYQNKSRKIQLIIDSRNRQNAAKGLVEYLSLRRLSLRIFILVDGDTDVKRAVDTCLTAGENCYATLGVNSNEKDAQDLLAALSRVYPLGAISVIDI